MGEGASFTDRYWPSMQEQKVIIPARQAREKYTRASLKNKIINKGPDEYLDIGLYNLFILPSSVPVQSSLVELTKPKT